MKRMFSLILALLLALSLAACASTNDTQAEQPAAAVTKAPVEPAAESVVTFTDPVLEEMIRVAMGIPEGDITAAQAEEVTSLDLKMDGNDWSKPRISDISALGSFKKPHKPRSRLGTQQQWIRRRFSRRSPV